MTATTGEMSPVPYGRPGSGRRLDAAARMLLAYIAYFTVALAIFATATLLSLLP